MENKMTMLNSAKFFVVHLVNVAMDSFKLQLTTNENHSSLEMNLFASGIVT